jgi:hypothetical protein
MRSGGHKHLSTTSLYVQPNERAALETLDAVVPRRAPRSGAAGGHKAKSSRANGGT